MRTFLIFACLSGLLLSGCGGGGGHDAPPATVYEVTGLDHQIIPDNDPEDVWLVMTDHDNYNSLESVWVALQVGERYTFTFNSEGVIVGYVLR